MQQGMREAYAVTGYVSGEAAKELANAGWVSSGRHVDVSPDASTDAVVTRVPAGSVADVRVGASEKGKTLVQLILKENVGLETIVRNKAAKGGLQQFHDPVISHLVASAVINKIFI